MQFFLTIVSLLLAVSAAPIDTTESKDAVYAADYNGIFGRACEAVLNRLSKFGQCLSAEPEFQKLTQNFWYQAAAKTLCGDSLQFNSTTALVYQEKYGNSTSLFGSDEQAEIAADFLYSLNTNYADASNPFEKRDDSDISFGLPQCLNLCDIIREGSNNVRECWTTYSLTALYGVCEVGCHYYL